MTIVPLTFGVRSSPGRFGGPDGINRLVNCFSEDRGQEGKIRFPLVASPGLRLFGQADNQQGIRGAFELENGIVVVAGAQVYLVDQAGTFTRATGEGVPGTAPVTLAANRRKPYREVVIVSEGLRLVLDTDPTSLTVSRIEDPDLPPPIDCGFVDGYILYLIADGRMYNSDLEDATSVNALAFVTAEGAADGGVALHVRKREVFLFGERTTEVFANTAVDPTLPSPFTRSLDQFIAKGIIGRHAVANFQETLAFIDHEGTPRLMNGYTPVRLGSVSQCAAVARSVSKCSNKASIIATSYTLENNEWVQFTCPGEFTWEYNGATGNWNERESEVNTVNQKSYRASHSVRLANQILQGDVSNGKLYIVDHAEKSEAGETMIVTMQAPHQHSYPGRLKCKAFFADLVPGVGLGDTGDDAENPRGMLQWSDDNGNTWSPVRQLQLGQIGAKKKQIEERRLGRSGEDGRVWRISISANVCRGLTGAAVDVQQRKPGRGS